MFDIRQDDLTHPQTLALLVLHLQGMHAHSPAGRVFALDLSALQTPDVTVWTAWQAGTAVGLAALKRLSPYHGELKSMRTHPAHLRRGIAAALLDHMIAEARTRQLHRLSLETGSGPAFDPALALYRTRGFASGEPFAAYIQSPFNRFLHLTL